MPKDFVDLAVGEDPHKLLDLLNLVNIKIIPSIHLLYFADSKKHPHITCPKLILTHFSESIHI